MGVVKFTVLDKMAESALGACFLIPAEGKLQCTKAAHWVEVERIIMDAGTCLYNYTLGTVWLLD